MSRLNSASGIAKAAPAAGLALVLGSTPAAAGTASAPASGAAVAPAPSREPAPDSAPAASMLWVEDGPDRAFEPVAQTEETWLDELSDRERELAREYREARRNEVAAAQEPPREEAPGLIWV